MKRIVPLCAVMLCALVIGLGCGDDKTTTITQYDTVVFTDTVPTPVLAKGYALLLPALGLRISGQKVGFSSATPSERVYPLFSVHFWGTEPIRPAVDRVVFADSVCDIHLAVNPLFSEPYAYAQYRNLVDTLRFNSGDTIGFVFDAYFAVSSGEITILDFQADTAEVLDAANPDTVSIGSDIFIRWNSVPHAEWYGIQVQYIHSAFGLVSTYNQFDFTLGTTYVVRGSEVQFDGIIRVYVVPITGPVPDAAAGNIFGGAVTGTIYSYAKSTSALVYVGTGDPNPPLAKGLTGSSDDVIDDTLVDGWDIIEAITTR